MKILILHLQVDHIDEDKTNNHISNLQQLTYKKHGVKTHGKAVNMFDRNNDTVVLRSFESMTAAAEYLNTIEEFQNREVRTMADRHKLCN